MAACELLKFYLEGTLGIVLIRKPIEPGEQQEQGLHIARGDVVVEVLKRLLIPHIHIFSGERFEVGARHHQGLHAVVRRSRPVLNNDVVERNATNVIFEADRRRELVLCLVIGADQVPESAFVKAVADDDVIGMDSLVPQVKEFLVFERNRIGVYAGVQHRKLTRELAIQFFLQLGGISVTVIDAISVGNGIAEAENDLFAGEIGRAATQAEIINNGVGKRNLLDIFLVR